jgi:hypothetical protein
MEANPSSNNKKNANFSDNQGETGIARIRQSGSHKQKYYKIKCKNGSDNAKAFGHSSDPERKNDGSDSGAPSDSDSDSDSDNDNESESKRVVRSRWWYSEKPYFE